MTNPTTSSSPATSTDASSSPRRQRGDRRDDRGRAYAGSQMCLQVWVNRREPELSGAVLRSLGQVAPEIRLEWVSPLEGDDFAEYKDGAFLDALGLGTHRSALAAFWPKGGPVWDGLAKIVGADGTVLGYVLIEAKSYPAEVKGGGCKATKGSKSRTLVESSLLAAARWLGLSTVPEIWVGKLYQSANRIAHVHFLRHQLGLQAYMVNVCFIGDPLRPTTEERWKEEKDVFRRDLQIDGVPAPWLVDVYLPAAARTELLSDRFGTPS